MCIFKDIFKDTQGDKVKTINMRIDDVIIEVAEGKTVRELSY